MNRAACAIFFFFFSSRRRHTMLTCDWSSDVCSSDLLEMVIRGDEEGVERIADDRRKQRRQDQLPRGTFQHVSERGMEVPGHRVVEDRGLGDHAERDLRPDEQGLERWGLAR